MKHIAVFVLALAACTHNQKLASPADLHGEEVTIEVTTAPGVEVEGRVMRGPYGYVVQTYNYGPVDIGQIKRIEQEKTWVGALEGLGLGVLIGGATGAVLGYADGDDECMNDHCWFALDAGGKAMIGGVVLGALGGIIGLAAGAMRGSHYVYEF